MSPIARADSSTPTLPTGTLTFLLTDIEGSTRLWQSAPDAMQVALARHDVILRQGIETHGGHVFKTTGDAFFAAFTTPWLALDAALAMQQALQIEAWPPLSPIRVRMALHSGAAELRGGDYFGQPLNHVARLLSTGHGGQTLISSVTCELCHDRLPAGVALKSLGEHMLKDLARRQTIYQLEHPSLPQAFPPLRTQSALVDRQAPSIAVMPFVNLSHDDENEYFADGLAEELLNVLAKIHGLRVSSRISAFYFKGKDIDIPTVAQKLNVATILEGSVRKSGNRVRIAAQLIEVATDSHLWSQVYDRELDDIFAVQDDIAQSVVTELRSALLGERIDAAASAEAKAEVAAAMTGRAENVEAYRLYLQARFHVDHGTRESTAHAVECLKQALDLDPDFALGWAGLSVAIRTQRDFGFVAGGESVETARRAALRSIALAPDLAEGHVALGQVFNQYDWNWKAADAEFQRALVLAPGNADVMRAVANLAKCLGRQDEAIKFARRASELDPLSTKKLSSYALHCVASGRFDDAHASLASALVVDPGAGLVHAVLAWALLWQGRYPEALSAAEREVRPLLRAWVVALVQHALGNAAASDAALRELIDAYADGGACQIAEVMAYRGRIDEAFEWLERAYQQRDAGLPPAIMDPALATLRGDPRWQPFVRKVGLA